MELIHLITWVHANVDIYRNQDVRCYVNCVDHHILDLLHADVENNLKTNLERKIISQNCNIYHLVIMWRNITTACIIYRCF